MSRGAAAQRRGGRGEAGGDLGCAAMGVPTRGKRGTPCPSRAESDAEEEDAEEDAEDTECGGGVVELQPLHPSGGGLWRAGRGSGWAGWFARPSPSSAPSASSSGTAGGARAGVGGDEAGGGWRSWGLRLGATLCLLAGSGLLVLAVAQAWTRASDAADVDAFAPRGVRLSVPSGAGCWAGDACLVITWTTFADAPSQVVFTARSAPVGPWVGGMEVGAVRSMPLGGLAPHPKPENAPGHGGWDEAVGTTTVFRAKTLEDPVRYIHRVNVRGLVPGHRYMYKCGAPGRAWSAAFEFVAPDARTGEAAGEAGRLRTVAVIGDMGRAMGRHVVEALSADVRSGRVEAVLQVGDLAYDLYRDGGRQGDAFLELVEGFAAYAPYHVLPGNHEAVLNFTHYRALFSMPGWTRGDEMGQSPSEGSAEGLFHGFDWGPLHFSAYNTEAYFWPMYFGNSSRTRMHAWMRADLGGVDRAQTPWVVAAGHRPMYCPYVQPGAPPGLCPYEFEVSRLGCTADCSHYGDHDCWCVDAEGEGLAPGGGVEGLLCDAGVDVAVFGHVHEYARFHPVRGGQLKTAGTSVTRPEEPPGSPGVGFAYADGGRVTRYDAGSGAPVHLINGAGGNEEMLSLNASAPVPMGRCDASAEPACAFHAGCAPTKGALSHRPQCPDGGAYDISYGEVSANATHLVWRQRSARLGAYIDEFWIVQPGNTPTQQDQA